MLLIIICKVNSYSFAHKKGITNKDKTQGLVVNAELQTIKKGDSFIVDANNIEI